MKEFIEKLIGRLEEETQYVDLSNPSSPVRCVVNAINPHKVIEIVNQLAEEYKGEELQKSQKIYNFIKREINPYGKPFEGTVYEFGLKVMNYITKLHTEEYNNDWIPCSDRLPEENGYYLITIKYYHLHNNVTMGCFFDDGEWYKIDKDDKVIAWQPLPTPYEPKGE